MLNTEDRIEKFYEILQIFKSGYSLDECISLVDNPLEISKIYNSLNIRSAKNSKTTYRDQFINGFVYIIQQEGINEIKIGFASNVIKRLKGLQTGSSKKLNVIRVYRGNIHYEKLIHKLLVNYHLSGEWFNLTDELLLFTDRFFDFFMLDRTNLYLESINSRNETKTTYQTARSQTSYKELSNVYAVKKGRNPGIYYSWANCKSQVDKFPGGVYKKFNTIKEAEVFLKS